MTSMVVTRMSCSNVWLKINASFLLQLSITTFINLIGLSVASFKENDSLFVRKK